MPPRKLRRTPEERSLRAIARMSAGTISGYIESASPSRRIPDPKITQLTPSGGGHPHDGAPANTTIVGGVNEGGPSVPVVSGPQSVVVGDYASSTAVSGSFGGVVVIGAGNSTASRHKPEAGAEAIGAVVIGSYGSSFSTELAPHAGGYTDVVIGMAAFTIDESDGGDENVCVGPNSKSYGYGNVAIGSVAVVGSSSPGGIDLTVAIGYHCFVGTDYGIAIGEHATVNATCKGGVAIGEGAGVTTDGTYTDSEGGIAIGFANGSSSGGGARGKGAISIGSKVGSGSNDPGAHGEAAICIGSRTPNGGKPRATADFAIVIGGDTTSSFARAIAFGKSAVTTATDQLALAPDMHVELDQLAAAPATPGSAHLRLYAKDDGSGETRLFYISDLGTEYGPL